MALPDPPARWGNDDITAFIDSARHNAFATFSNLGSAYQKLAQIEAAIRKLATHLDHADNWLAGLFILRAHSSWLTAANLAMSCQVFETMVILRSCIETALYGLRIHHDPALAETWLKRSDGAQDKAAVLKAFKFRALIDTLAHYDAREAKVAKTLYDQCIDDGAHPNERGFMGNLAMDKNEKSIRFSIRYQNAEPLALAFALKTTARVGVCTLGIFRCMYKERFDLLGLSNDLPGLRKGL